jgi:hypothetical protein
MFSYSVTVARVVAVIPTTPTLVPPLCLQAELMQGRKAGRQTGVTPFTERDATNKDRSVSLL